MCIRGVLGERHLTFPSLCDGPLPLPRFAAERVCRGDVAILSDTSLHCVPPIPLKVAIDGFLRFKRKTDFRNGVGRIADSHEDGSKCR